MSDVVGTGRSADIQPIIARLATPGAVAILEHVPTHWLNSAEQAVAIQAVRMPHQLDVATYRRGRLFHESFELRWEPDGADLSVGYIGVAPIPEELAFDPALPLHVARDHWYDLWGEPIRQPHLIDRPAGAALFGALRLPRLLTYPVDTPAARVRLRVRQYYAAEGGPLLLSRFCALEGVAE